jgi:DNA ligase D-like protein (predicted ligase)
MGVNVQEPKHILICSLEAGERLDFATGKRTMAQRQRGPGPSGNQPRHDVVGRGKGRRDAGAFTAGSNPLDGLPAQAKARLRKRAQPEWVAPMLATLTEERFSREGWLFEPKWDGERCLAFRRGCDDLKLYSRNRIVLNDRYPEIVAALQRQEVHSFIADGEIVTFERGITSFAKLQQRMQLQHPSPDLLRRVPVWLHLFDLLYLDGYDTRQVPLGHRKQLLRGTFNFRGSLRFTEHCETEGEAYYRRACKKRWEGIIAKNGASIYVSRRTRDWLKFKCQQQQEFVIGGYTDPKGSRVGFGALLVGFYRNGNLVYAGKVGTGFDRDTLQRLGGRLALLETSTSPFALGEPPRRNVHWVKPKLVAEIRFTEWTTAGKLRHPRFLGLRQDKRAEEVVREG